MLIPTCIPFQWWIERGAQQARALSKFDLLFFSLRSSFVLGVNKKLLLFFISNNFLPHS